MKQAVWTGAISFGLVSIPVQLYPATEPKDVRFHLYDRRSGKRVRYERVTRVKDAPLFLPEPSRSGEDSDESPDEGEVGGGDKADGLDHGGTVLQPENSR